MRKKCRKIVAKCKISCQHTNNSSILLKVKCRLQKCIQNMKLYHLITRIKCMHPNFIILVKCNRQFKDLQNKYLHIISHKTARIEALTRLHKILRRRLYLSNMWTVLLILIRLGNKT